ncbi:hypothetical protein J8I87_13515 [Paraburkholderia sp. LEh10]|jgi:hypothetical protein|uniref:hypothetical protein n=1 Tax=Paraburkholderia sp. LEh10 TaxID=2821353 RepID=UPI001AEB03C0|nr:hypothetical protein [Paraburkholderia sp. LEh10]MBP0590718.1 hypothetical protein [Paraburkholderia sp. LEh10]
MRDLFRRLRPRGHCGLVLSRDAVSVRRVGASRKAAPVVVERKLAGLDGHHDAAADMFAAQLAAALDEAGCNGLPVHATLADDLVRYFIVTPPANGARMQDLRAAVELRFQTLYGDAASAWQVAADWQAAEPFLGCAVLRRVSAALQIAVKQRGGCLVSVTPNFVSAWNRSRKQIGANAWLATLSDSALTLGLVADTSKPRLASVRTLMLPEPNPPLTWLRESVARTALLDNVAAPAALHVHGPQMPAWQEAASSGEAGMKVLWRESGSRPRSFKDGSASFLSRFGRSGAAS